MSSFSWLGSEAAADKAFIRGKKPQKNPSFRKGHSGRIRGLKSLLLRNLVVKKPSAAQELRGPKITLESEDCPTLPPDHKPTMTETLNKIKKEHSFVICGEMFALINICSNIVGTLQCLLRDWLIYSSSRLVLLHFKNVLLSSSLGTMGCFISPFFVYLHVYLQFPTVSAAQLSTSCFTTSCCYNRSCCTFLTNQHIPLVLIYIYYTRLYYVYSVELHLI